MEDFEFCITQKLSRDLIYSSGIKLKNIPYITLKFLVLTFKLTSIVSFRQKQQKQQKKKSKFTFHVSATGAKAPPSIYSDIVQWCDAIVTY